MSRRGVDLGRRRSRFVFERATRWDENSRKEITTLAQGLPVTLRTQGLVVALARLSAAEGTASRVLGDMLFAWLAGEAPHMEWEPPVADAGELLKRLMEEERSTYLAVQREALALSERIKLISKAFFSGRERTHGA